MPLSAYIHTPTPGRLANIHAHPLMIVGIDTIASDDGGHRGTGGGGGEEQGWIVGEGEYTVCTKYVRWQIRVCQVGEVYVCARDNMHVWYVSTISASLTWFLAAMSMPFFKSREQISLWPLTTARCNAVSPYNNRETETEIDRPGTQRRMGICAGAGRQGTVG